MPILETLHDSAIEARDEYTALVLAEATGTAEERDPHSIRELLAIVGKSADQLSRDIATARQRHGAAADCERANKLRAEVAGLQENKRHLQAELKRVVEQAEAMVREAQKPLAQLEHREANAKREADALWQRSTGTMQMTGESVTDRAAEYQKQIDEVRASVVIERTQVQNLGPAANKVVDEIAPRIERLERVVKSGGPPACAAELEQARERLNKALATLDTLAAHKKAIDAAEARALELEADKQAALNAVPDWRAIDFFADAPSKSQVFGRPVMS